MFVLLSAEKLSTSLGFMKIDSTESSKEERDVLNSAIQNLDDDSLILIFQNLSIVDKIKIERVCRRWQELAKQSWSNFKELKLNAKDLGLKPYGTTHQYKKIDDDIFEKILQRCGRYLVKIQLFFSCALLRFDYYLAKYCANISELSFSRYRSEFIVCNEKELENSFSNLQKLQVLNLGRAEIKNFGFILKLPVEEINTIKIKEIDVDRIDEDNLKIISNVVKRTKKLRIFEVAFVNESLIMNLEKNCRNLTKLKLHNSNQCNIDNIDDKLSRLFSNNQKLEYLKLSEFRNVTGKCFLYLNKNIEKISLEEIFFDLEFQYLITILKCCKKIYSLKFDCLHFRENDYDELAKCIGLFPNLRHLYISYEWTLTDNFMKSVSSLKNLEKLTVNNVSEISIITETFCNDIRANLHELKFLDISDCEDLNDYHIELICNLPKLEVLKIEFNRDITGRGLLRGLSNQSNLKKLYCEYCCKLQNDGLIKLLKTARNLEVLDIRDCKKITTHLINVAIEVTKIRTNDIVLEIFIAGTNIEVNELKQKSPLLFLQTSKKSKYWDY